MFCMILGIKRDCFPEQDELVGLCNGDAVYDFCEVGTLLLNIMKEEASKLFPELFVCAFPQLHSITTFV
jgi:hypothetical protein